MGIGRESESAEKITFKLTPSPQHTKTTEKNIVNLIQNVVIFTFIVYLEIQFEMCYVIEYFVTLNSTLPLEDLPA